MCVCSCVYVYTSACAGVCKFVRVCGCLCIFVCVYMYVCVRVSQHEFAYGCTCTRIITSTAAKVPASVPTNSSSPLSPKLPSSPSPSSTRDPIPSALRAGCPQNRQRQRSQVRSWNTGIQPRIKIRHRDRDRQCNNRRTGQGLTEEDKATRKLGMMTEISTNDKELSEEIHQVWWARLQRSSVGGEGDGRSKHYATGRWTGGAPGRPKDNGAA